MRWTARRLRRGALSPWLSCMRQEVGEKVTMGLRLLLVAALCVLLGACGEPADEADGLTPLTVQLDWYPEPEHGGLYQAQARGFFREEGLRVEILPGGNNTPVIPLASAGRVEVTQAGSNQVILAASRGAPVRIIASVFHDSPTVLMLHDQNPVHRFEELAGRTIVGRTEALYIPYLKNKYAIEFDVVPQTFGLGRLINDPSTIQEGFYIAEFYYLEKAGVAPRAMKLRDAGYSNSIVLAANAEWLERAAESAQGFVRAYVRGWRDYLEGDPAPGNRAMTGARAAMGLETDPEFLRYVRAHIIRDQLAAKEQGAGYGALPLAVYHRQVEQLESIGVLDPGRIRAEAVLWTEGVDSIGAEGPEAE